MQSITYQELKTALEKTFLPKENFTHLYNDYYKDLFYTGCRPNELFSIKNFSISTSITNQVIFQPFKKNNIRYFEKDKLSQNLQDAIIGQYLPYAPLTKWRVLYGFRFFFPLSQTYVRDKYTDLYLFRYLKVKSLFLAGKTSLEVQSAFGWKDSFLPQRYNTAVIYTK